MDPVLETLIHATGGKLLNSGNAAEILEEMQTTRYSSKVFPASVEEKLKLDLLRNREPSAIIICCVMLALEAPERVEGNVIRTHRGIFK